VKILAADTALGACSAAVLDDGKILAHRFEAMERGHAERLAPMVESVMREAGVPFAALDRLAVTTGPGTFTGQRVGLAFMRGLRVALKRPLIGVTTLQAIARQAMDETGARIGAVLHDAKRGEFYFGVSEGGNERIAPTLLTLEAAIAELRKIAALDDMVLAGTAAQAAFDALGDPSVKISATAQPDALWVARIALEKPETSHAPKPLYLRPSDARLPAQPQ
jgi:tRNA threonylcarbamoyladenosine biosynthesis protein TsaB